MERERNLLLHGQGEKLPEAGNSKQQDIISRKRAKVSTEASVFIKVVSLSTVKANHVSVTDETQSTQNLIQLKIPPKLANHPVFSTNRETNQLILTRRAKVGDNYYLFDFYTVRRILNFVNNVTSLAFFNFNGYFRIPTK